MATFKELIHAAFDDEQADMSKEQIRTVCENIKKRTGVIIHPQVDEK